MPITIPSDLVNELKNTAKRTGPNEVSFSTNEVTGNALANILNDEFGNCATGSYPLESLPPQGTLVVKGRAPLEVLQQNGIEVPPLEVPSQKVGVQIPSDLIQDLQRGRPRRTGPNEVTIGTDENTGNALAAILNEEFGKNAAVGSYPMESFPPRGSIVISGRAPVAALLDNGLEVEGLKKSAPAAGRG